MKKIGLIGGMSWESTQVYYRLINEGVKKRLGGLHSAEVVLYSLDFASIEAMQTKGDWQGAAELLVQAATSLQKAGADFLLICTNTMHKVADEVAACVQIPLLHIADATAEELKGLGVEQVGLLGTAFTMEQDFYKGRLQSMHGLDVIVPDDQDRAEVHRVIYEELCLGQLEASSKARYLETIEKLEARGAQAVILGCTEIGLLVAQQDCQIQLLDTTQIHAECAVRFALGQES